MLAEKWSEKSYMSVPFNYLMRYLAVTISMAALMLKSTAIERFMFTLRSFTALARAVLLLW